MCRCEHRRHAEAIAIRIEIVVQHDRRHLRARVRAGHIITRDRRMVGIATGKDADLHIALSDVTIGVTH